MNNGEKESGSAACMPAQARLMALLSNWNEYTSELKHTHTHICIYICLTCKMNDLQVYMYMICQ